MTEQFNVLILGHGEMGRAIEYLLKDQHQLTIWERHPPENKKAIVLEDAASQADIIIFCLPVNPHRVIAEHIAAHIKTDCLCLSIAKGLDQAGQTAAQIFSECLPENNPYVLLYGPMISEEIRQGRNAFAQLGYREKDSFNKIYHLFQDTQLYIEPTEDITGISWSVILKNVYALIFGMADELQLGDNMRGYLAVAALKELDLIVKKMGGQMGSSYHLAGLGDLITTATSTNSHHHELGCMLAREETENINGEGVHTLEMVKQFQHFTVADYPLFHLIQSIVDAPKNIREKINHYLQNIYS
ncbi:MAG: hypothetical protein OQK75_04200 [Gammaproteobacteria bacterium]|nr:hypothetical protein [Gammaproteobacteria bacterium]MCW8986852.1 hypothetical protein [Gammaproteobacteria bacterium]